MLGFSQLSRQKKPQGQFKTITMKSTMKKKEFTHTHDI